MSASFFVEFEELTSSFDLEFETLQVVEVNGDIPTYTGSYDIRPQIEAQVMETANKRMAHDVNIQAIPYYAVSNLQNGQTVIIGGDN